MTCCKETTSFAEQEFRTGSQQVSGSLYQSELIVPKMHCAACISQIEKSLTSLHHVESARANLSLRRVTIVWDAAIGDGSALQEKLTEIGFESYPTENKDQANDTLKVVSKQLLLALAVAGFASANIMLLSISVWSGASDETAKLFHLISGLIAIPAVAIAGRPFFGSALKALSARRLNMDVPISLAVLLALGMGIVETLSGGTEAYFDACVMLLFFLLIGRYLDHLMREKARSSVSSLVQLTAKGGVLVKENGALAYTPQNEIEIGQTLRVMPGERFPVDGKICFGRSDVDRSLVSGESTSVLVDIGDLVEAGTLNLTGAVDIVTTADAQTSFLAEVMIMMTAAENGRGAYVRIAERAAKIYAPAVHLIALTTFITWVFVSGGDWRASLYTAIAVLIITCPCALGLAVPVVHVIGANRLFKEGILMRDGSAFERLAEVDEVVFDKTGTLTIGLPTASDAVNAPMPIAKMIATLCARSAHPVSTALQKTFQPYLQVDLQNITEIAGFGVEAQSNGKSIRLGRPLWVAEIADCKTSTEETGSVAFAIEDGSIYHFELNDAQRDDAEQAVAALHKAGLSTTILSGDHPRAVRKLAERLSIDTYQAEMNPAEKVDYLQGQISNGINTLMVGDGLNDAPALTSAHVSMAPASASEVGRLASDFIFTRGSLSAVPFAWQIARRTNSLIKQNFAIAVVYNCLAIPFAIVGQVTPLIAAIAMSLSSIVVVANSMRLNIGGGQSFAKRKKSTEDNVVETTGSVSSNTMGVHA